MLNALKSKTKNIICAVILCIMMVCSSSAINSYSHREKAIVDASTQNYITEDITSTVFSSGYNFATSSTSYPASVSGWTELTNESFNSDNIKRGIVNVKDETTFDTDDCGTTRPSMPIADKDDSNYYKNLMINSTNGAGKFGYKNNSAISLDANSFYQISVYVYTQKLSKGENIDETDPRASIYLTGLFDKDDDNYNQTKFESFSTLGQWETYSFYIDTKEAASVNIELWLGSKSSTEQGNVQGAVFFNNVRITKYSEDYYVERILSKEDSNNNNFNIISLRNTFTSPITNGDFENPNYYWTNKSLSTSSPDDQIMRIIDANSDIKINDDLTITAPGSNCSANNKLVLFMYNKDEGYQSIESNEFSISQQSYYRLSFWAKSGSNDGSGATVKLIDKSDKPIEEATITTQTSITTDKFRNDWSQYNFYIYGPSIGNKNVAVKICFGTQDAKAKGYVFIDDFRLETIDYSIYSSNSANSNSTTFDLNNGTDKYTIANSDFDKTQNDETDASYPLVPASWTRSGNENSNTFSGVVCTNASFDANIDRFGKNGLLPTKPSKLPYAENNDNNVLMIGSTAETNSQTFTSSNISLTANSYYRISFYVMTDYDRHDMNSNTGASVKIYSENNVYFHYFNINYANWQKFEVLIKTGVNDDTAKIDLTFDGIGYAFFDKVQLSSINETTYNDTTLQQADINYIMIDMTKEDFSNRTFNKNYSISNPTEAPNGWNDKEENNISVNYAGTINANSSLLGEVPHSLSGNTNYLVISSLSDVNYTFTSKNQYTFTAGTYYKVSVNILTNNIHKDTDETYHYDLGASFKIANDTDDNEDLAIVGIDTNGIWKTYTLYLCLNESKTSSIKLSLGNTKEPTSGEVLFDNLVIETIDETKYTDELANQTLGNFKSFINYEAENEETTDEGSEWTNSFNNWLIIPSIITALAIIIAVIGFYVRKISFNKKPKVKTNYDRRKTLDKDIDKREKIALRQQIIDELNAELDSIDKEMQQYSDIADQEFEVIKEKIVAEQEEIKQKKLDIEIKKKEATANREKQLKENPDIAKSSKAEKEYNNFISKLDKQEMALQKQLTEKDVKLANAKEQGKDKLSKYLERKEFIKNEIAKIEAEIEQIAKEEEQMWEEYRAAKADAKRRKAEYKAEVKAEKQATKVQRQKAKANKQATKKSHSKKD